MSSSSPSTGLVGTDVLGWVRAALGSGTGLAGVDLDGLAQSDLRALGEALGRARRELDVMVAKVAAAQARRSTSEDGAAGMARRNGKPSPKGLVSGQTGGSEFDAGRLIDVGEILDDAAKPAPEPTTGERSGDGGGSAPAGEEPPAGPRFVVLPAAVEAAEVSIEAASTISRMLKNVFETADPVAWVAAERELVAKAKLLNLKQLSRVVRQVEADLDRKSLAQREMIQHADRYLHVIEEASGMVKIIGLLDVETAAPIKAALDAIVGKSLQAKRDKTAVTADERTVPQMRADALALVARHMLAADDTVVPRGAATLVIRTTTNDVQDAIDAAGRGEASDGVASVDGFGQPITAATARRLTGDSELIPVSLTADGAVLNLGRSKRPFNRAQRLALVERDGGCAMCGAPPSHCEAHHIREWVKDKGPTDLDNGLLLCSRCHHDLHRQGWTVHATPTEVWFTPPKTIDPEQRRRPGGRMLHDHIPLTPEALEELEAAGTDSVGAATSRRHTTTPIAGTNPTHDGQENSAHAQQANSAEPGVNGQNGSTHHDSQAQHGSTHDKQDGLDLDALTATPNAEHPAKHSSASCAADAGIVSIPADSSDAPAPRRDARGSVRGVTKPNVASQDRIRGARDRTHPARNSAVRAYGSGRTANPRCASPVEARFAPHLGRAIDVRAGDMVGAGARVQVVFPETSTDIL
ncbi:HNH endonuclease signature motif containing protein [Demequina sp. NBRC 110056]|uniref:HNH endonuclease signature motif containing protein n=1 Tax=Demequina sp. NBRC 110056 TaxID=1570345 RepID=UPI000A073F6F|nr:HNH endonuclease signature motif containing protein [Demequina sp. NBRC 110056]